MKYIDDHMNRFVLKQGYIIVKCNCCAHEGSIVYKNKFRRQKREPYTCVTTLRLQSSV